MAIKSFRLHTHHYTSFVVKKSSKLFFLAWPFAILKFSYGAIYIICKTFGYAIYKFNYIIGTALLAAAEYVIYRLSVEWKRTTESLIERREKIYKPYLRFSIAAFAFFCVAIMGFFKLAGMAAVANQVKQTVLRVGLLGDDQLKDAKNSLEQQNFSLAQANFIKARDSFQNGQRELEKLGSVTNALLNLVPQKRDGQKLLGASKDLSEAGVKLIDFYNQVSLLKSTQSGLSANESDTGQILKTSKQLLNEATVLTLSASQKFGEVNPDILPQDRRDEFVNTVSNLNKASESLATLNNIYGVLVEMLVGQKDVLLIFQNNNELRATGGFVGTYGNMRLLDGQITALKISSIYDLDGQLKEKILPPDPIYAVNDRWFMRDSNWFIDFPQSAKKLSVFYEKSGGETPDMVIAITAGFISDILNATGPIDMQNYGLTLTSENFIEQMQAASTLSTEEPTNEPKKVLADFFPLLVQKISELPNEQKTRLLEALESNIRKKNILAYSRHNTLQSAFSSFGWSGEILNSDRDFLTINSSNLGGTKTDLSVVQSYFLKSEIEPDGSIINTLAITRTNNNSLADFTVNSSFIRVVVPLGSQLISAAGFDYRPLDMPKDKEMKVDSDIATWQNQAVRDLTTGTIIGKESDKSFFGNWIILKGGETRIATIKYKLPYVLKETDRYSMVLQKQPGAQGQVFSHEVKFPGRQIEWKSFSASAMETNYIRYENKLEQDDFYGMVFKTTSHTYP